MSTRTAMRLVCVLLAAGVGSLAAAGTTEATKHSGLAPVLFALSAALLVAWVAAMFAADRIEQGRRMRG